MESESGTTGELRDRDPAEPEPGARRSSSLPLTLTIVSLLVWFGFQTAQLVVERSNLIQLKGNLDPAMQEAQKVRAQLKTLITRTAELANRGNASARTVVAELEKRGIPIKSAAERPQP